MKQITRDEVIELLKDGELLAEVTGNIDLARRYGPAITALQAAEPVAWIEIRDCDCEECEWEQDVTTDPLWAKHYPDKWTPLFTLPCPPAKDSHWSFENPGRADQYRAEALAARRALGFREDADDVAPADLEDAINALRQPATELAPESWREELETIAEILEADGDEWHCAARIRKMLTASPAPDRNTDSDKHQQKETER